MKLTLAVLYNDKEVLLAKKLKGKFGVGKWNGYGGFIEEGETIEGAAYREIEEESGITRAQLGKDLEPAGLVRFWVFGETEPREVYLYRHDSFSGQPSSTEEGKFEHRWFPRDQLPLGEMFGADTKWLADFIAGKNLLWEIHYTDPDFKNCEVTKVEEWKM